MNMNFKCFTLKRPPKTSNIVIKNNKRNLILSTVFFSVLFATIKQIYGTNQVNHKETDHGNNISRIITDILIDSKRNNNVSREDLNKFNLKLYQPWKEAYSNHSSRKFAGGKNNNSIVDSFIFSLVKNKSDPPVRNANQTRDRKLLKIDKSFNKKTISLSKPSVDIPVNNSKYHIDDDRYFLDDFLIKNNNDAEPASIEDKNNNSLIRNEVNKYFLQRHFMKPITKDENDTKSILDSLSTSLIINNTKLKHNSSNKNNNSDLIKLFSDNSGAQIIESRIPPAGASLNINKNIKFNVSIESDNETSFDDQKSAPVILTDDIIKHNAKDNHTLIFGKDLSMPNDQEFNDYNWNKKIEGDGNNANLNKKGTGTNILVTKIKRGSLDTSKIKNNNGEHQNDENNLSKRGSALNTEKGVSSLLSPLDLTSLITKPKSKDFDKIERKLSKKEPKEFFDEIKLTTIRSEKVLLPTIEDSLSITATKHPIEILDATTEIYHTVTDDEVNGAETFNILSSDKNEKRGGNDMDNPNANPFQNLSTEDYEYNSTIITTTTDISRHNEDLGETYVFEKNSINNNIVLKAENLYYNDSQDVHDDCSSENGSNKTSSDIKSLTENKSPAKCNKTKLIPLDKTLNFSDSPHNTSKQVKKIMVQESSTQKIENFSESDILNISLSLENVHKITNNINESRIIKYTNSTNNKIPEKGESNTIIKVYQQNENFSESKTNLSDINHSYSSFTENNNITTAFSVEGTAPTLEKLSTNNNSHLFKDLTSTKAYYTSTVTETFTDMNDYFNSLTTIPSVDNLFTKSFNIFSKTDQLTSTTLSVIDVSSSVPVNGSFNIVNKVSNTSDNEAIWPVKLASVVEGDIILGGLMMVHSREDSVTCGPIMPQGGIQALEAMLYTLDRLNSDPSFMPNVTLGAHILDDCDKDTYGLEMAVDFIKGFIAAHVSCVVVNYSLGSSLVSQSSASEVASWMSWRSPLNFLNWINARLTANKG